MTQHFIKLLLFFILALPMFKAEAQTLNLNQFGIEEGLPQSGIHALSQDKFGNIWIGTMAGISKFNGLVFENFNKTHGLAENRVTSSYIDKAGNIWFGHWAGGITKYNSDSRKFHEVLIPGADIYKSINCFFEDKNGSIWIGTNGLGLIKYEPSSIESKGPTDKESGTFTRIQKKDGLSNDIVNAIIQDKSGILWIATEDGITKINAKSKGRDYSFNYFSASNGLPTNSITALLKDSNGNIWMGSSTKGVFRIADNPSEKTIKIYDINDGLAGDFIKVIFEDTDKNIFIGTYGGGVSKYLPALERNHYKGPIFQTIGTSQGLSNDRVLSIIQDREKNIWIGTYLNLNQYFDEQFEIYGEQEGLINSLVWSVAQDKKGNYWLGTEGGLIKFNQELNSNQNSFVNYTINSIGSYNNITAIFEDVEGSIWFTNFPNGISKLDPETKKVTNYTTKDGLLSDEIYAITGDKAGNVWIGTNQGGASKFDIKTRKFQNYTIENGMGSNEVYSIYRDSKDNLWFGILGGNLTMYDGKKFVSFSEKDGYNNKFTVCITEDPNGNIWFGTYDAGIYKYDGKKFKNYSTKEGASYDTPFLLVCDNRNNLWIGTGLGIDKFNLKDETFKHYDKQDGFLGIEINPNASCKDKDGNLLFGSIIGLVKYNSKREKNNLVEPVTFLKNPRLYFKDAAIPDDHILAYNDNHLTFDFVGASLTNPKRVRYQYILDGLDKEWSPIKKDNFVTYPNIPPGTYTFKVKASNNDGIWNKDPQTYTFTVKPPFWKTWWFLTLSVIVVAACVYSYFKNRERILKAQNKILENKVTLRTAELREEKENVERQNIEISSQKVDLEKKNTKITDSITYAKKIQEAILPPLDQMRKCLPESFVLYKPKDIVSGDFYWMHEIAENHVLIAAADCTGHGVPGAFMSIMGYSLLEQIVNEHRIHQPAQILDELSKLLVQTLRQTDEHGSFTDGMDIALLSFKYNTKNGDGTPYCEVEYAGAHNSFYFIRDGVLHETKADSRSIGVKFGKVLNFSNHKIDLQKGDCCYIFSDGYTDQFGGPNNKKFYFQPFQQLLIDSHKMGMEEQRQKLDTVITDWKGQRVQIDDIMVMGIRV